MSGLLVVLEVSGLVDRGAQFREEQENRKISQLDTLRWQSYTDAANAVEKMHPKSAESTIQKEASNPNSELSISLRLHKKALHEVSPDIAGRHLSSIVNSYYGTFGDLQQRHLDHYMSHPGITDNHLLDHVLNIGARGSAKEALMSHPRIDGDKSMQAIIALSGLPGGY
jgi:hypothetical protein